jgi:hypothetical protein
MRGHAARQRRGARRRKSYEAGFQHHLVKPADMAAIEAALKASAVSRLGLPGLPGLPGKSGSLPP